MTIQQLYGSLENLTVMPAKIPGYRCKPFSCRNLLKCLKTGQLHHFIPLFPKLNQIRQGIFASQLHQTTQGCRLYPGIIVIQQ